MSYEQNKRADERNLSVKADNTVLTHSNYADQKCIHFEEFKLDEKKKESPCQFNSILLWQLVFWCQTLARLNYYYIMMKQLIWISMGQDFPRFCQLLTLKCSTTVQLTPLNSEIICGQNVGAKVVCGVILFFKKKAMLKIWKQSWVPFRSYLLNSTANPAQFECKWAGLAVLFSR